MVSSMAGVRTFLLVNAAGIAIASNRKELIGVDFHEGERYRAIRSHPGASTLYVSPPFMTPLGNWALSLGRAVLDADGGFDGYVLAIINPEYFNLLLDSTRYAPDMSVALIHGAGKIIYRVPDSGRCGRDGPLGEAGLAVPQAPREGRAHHHLDRGAHDHRCRRPGRAADHPAFGERLGRVPGRLLQPARPRPSSRGGERSGGTGSSSWPSSSWRPPPACSSTSGEGRRTPGSGPSGRTTAGSRTRRVRLSRRSWPRPRSWRAWGGSPGESPTTSTTCSPSSSATGTRSSRT